MVLRLASPLVGWTVGMDKSGFMDYVRGFWKRARYALPSMLLLWGFSCMWAICWCWEPAMVIVVGSLILMGVSVVASIA